MRPLHIIMPMAGEGSRFLKEGWMVPKPLIQLHGDPLVVFKTEYTLATGK